MGNFQTISFCKLLIIFVLNGHVMFYEFLLITLSYTRCSSKRFRVQWQPANIGLCPVEYTVQFLNNTGLLGNITSIEHANRSICSNEYFNATSIEIWATYNGNEGIKTRKMLSLTTTTTTTATATTTITTAEQSTVWVF